MNWFNGKKTYIIGALIAVFGSLQANPDFHALLGQWAGLTDQLLGLLVIWARSQVNASATPAA